MVLELSKLNKDLSDYLVGVHQFCQEVCPLAHHFFTLFNSRWLIPLHGWEEGVFLFVGSAEDVCRLTHLCSRFAGFCCLHTRLCELYSSEQLAVTIPAATSTRATTTASASTTTTTVKTPTTRTASTTTVSYTHLTLPTSCCV